MFNCQNHCRDLHLLTGDCTVEIEAISTEAIEPSNEVQCPDHIPYNPCNSYTVSSPANV